MPHHFFSICSTFQQEQAVTYQVSSLPPSPLFFLRAHALQLISSISHFSREGIASESSGDEQDPASATAEPSPEPEPGSASTLVTSTADGPTAAPSEEQLAAAAAAQARRRAADAALSRLAVAQQRVPVADGDNAGASANPAGDKSVAAGEVDVDMEGLTQVVGGQESAAKLLVAARVRTVGQLADRTEDELARELEALQAAGVRGGGGSSAPGGGEDDGGVEDRESEERVDAEKVAEWVQAARGEELDEIMFEIVGSHDDVVEASYIFTRGRAVLFC